jgi:hypothetical protein
MTTGLAGRHHLLEIHSEGCFMRLAFALLVCLAVCVFVSPAFAAEVTLKGNVTCAKCDLKVEGVTKCATVVVVKEGGKDVVYYFDEKSDKAHHKEICKAGKAGTVKGEVAEKDGKKVVTVKEVKFD